MTDQEKSQVVDFVVQELVEATSEIFASGDYALHVLPQAVRKLNYWLEQDSTKAFSLDSLVDATIILDRLNDVYSDEWELFHSQGTREENIDIWTQEYDHFLNMIVNP